MFFPPRAFVHSTLARSASATRTTAVCLVACRRSRLFTSSAARADRALVYAENGDPAKVLTVLTYPTISAPPPNSVNVKFLLAPINPADINVIEGVYPSKPTKTDALAIAGLGSEGKPVFVGGNEGVALVTAVGSGVKDLRVNDLVVMTKPQTGTWSTSKNVAITDVVKIPDAEQLSEVQCATITVNPATAYNMLTNFVELHEGDWVIQNGANSAVGQAVIQIAASRGLKTINLVRNRDNLDQLKNSLHSLGATQVLTYDELAEKSAREKVKSWTQGKQISLGLNCVGGKETTLMAKFLGSNAHLVSYGAMSKQPLSLPTSLFIFKNLTAHGFWQTQWYNEKSPAEREILMGNIVNLMVQKKLKTPEHEVVTVEAEDSDDQATEKMRAVMSKLAEGRFGKKVLLKIEDTE
ncbi:hypothetical protein BDQ12DRAFT_691998 [Crucibulum laeve]|uniref:enoyl-[acyl-carrier-protein] reductase n=1 Tax=Crucibulum laeve TaxID=68775 RepID=A0A5C3LLK1_9AGAR|nr:hypothetical protein BDQ12DRAFT_691998 [Crucibulum laeve]